MGENPFSSLLAEFKSAPPAGKALAVTAFMAVCGIGLYVGLHKKSGGGGATTLPINANLDTSGEGGVPFANMPALGGPPPIAGSIQISRPVTKLPVIQTSSGDTFEKIAHYAFGTTKAAASIAAANPGVNPGSPGSFIVLPKRTSDARVTVQAGDTWQSIAHYAYGTTGAASKLATANSNKSLVAGSTIIIPK